MAELGSENQRLQEKLRSLNESHQRTVRSLETRVAALTDDLEVTRSELRAIQTEYDSYKVNEKIRFSHPLSLCVVCCFLLRKFEI